MFQGITKMLYDLLSAINDFIGAAYNRNYVSDVIIPNLYHINNVGMRTPHPDWIEEVRSVALPLLIAFFVIRKERGLGVGLFLFFILVLTHSLYMPNENVMYDATQNHLIACVIAALYTHGIHVQRKLVLLAYAIPACHLTGGSEGLYYALEGFLYVGIAHFGIWQLGTEERLRRQAQSNRRFTTTHS